MLGVEKEEKLVADIPTIENGFICSREHDVASRFINEGYVIESVLDKESLFHVQCFVAHKAMEYLQLPISDNPIEFLNNVHKNLSIQQLNGLRVFVISALMGQDSFRPRFYRIAKEMLDMIVGNELVMQRGIGLSVQFPQDTSSLLNVHSDTWSGDSPFEVVVWLPLVDCYKTKTMFICTPDRSAEVNEKFSKYQKLNNAEFIKALEPDLTYLEVPFGSVLVFNQNQLHGNVVNDENETRWSMNCRFKSAFSPYCDKKLGEFFEPINLKPMTQIGLEYSYPDVKKRS